MEEEIQEQLENSKVYQGTGRVIKNTGSLLHERMGQNRNKAALKVILPSEAAGGVDMQLVRAVHVKIMVIDM